MMIKRQVMVNKMATDQMMTKKLTHRQAILTDRMDMTIDTLDTTDTTIPILPINMVTDTNPDHPMVTHRTTRTTTSMQTGMNHVNQTMRAIQITINTT